MIVMTVLKLRMMMMMKKKNPCHQLMVLALVQVHVKLHSGLLQNDVLLQYIALHVPNLDIFFTCDIALCLYHVEMFSFEAQGVTLYNGLYGEAPPERGTFFRLQVYKRVWISQV